MTGLTFGQAAARLGVDVQQIRRWVRHEDCPTVRDGRKVRIPADWVAQQLDRLAPTASTETPPCGYSWCCNSKPGHVTHWGNGETTANYSGPKSAAVSCIAFVETDHGGPYNDEIHLLVKTTNPGTDYASDIDEGIAVFLSEDEALQLRALIDTAIANRAEIRGQVEKRPHNWQRPYASPNPRLEGY